MKLKCIAMQWRQAEIPVFVEEIFYKLQIKSLITAKEA